MPKAVSAGEGLFINISISDTGDAGTAITAG
jgi:hypothetical protein